MLRSFWRALKTEELFTEDIHDRTIQGKMIKPVLELGNYIPRLRRVYFLPAENYPRWSWFAQLGTPPTGRCGEWSGGNICVHRPLGSPRVQWRRGNPCSPLVLGERSEQIKSCSWSLSGVEKCKETQLTMLVLQTGGERFPQCKCCSIEGKAFGGVCFRDQLWFLFFLQDVQALLYTKPDSGPAKPGGLGERKPALRISVIQLF